MRAFKVAQAAALCVLALRVSIAHGGWTEHGAPVCATVGDQHLGGAVEDGSGGMLVLLYHTYGPPPLCSLYVQRVSGAGDVASGWPECGVHMNATPSRMKTLDIVGDGGGGALICWSDDLGPNGPLHVQRVSSAGAIFPGWPPEGVDVATAGVYGSPVLARDGVGGAYILWNDGSVRLLRLAPDGSVASGWPVAGRVLAMFDPIGFGQEVVSDGSGGAIAIWCDTRDFFATSYDIYAQRVTSSGDVASGWPVDGTPITRATGDQGRSFIRAVPDGSGGALIAWQDGRDAVANPYAQRVTATGGIAAGWPVDGLRLSAANNFTPGVTPHVEMAADGMGGAFVAWEDSRDTQIWAQHASAAGAVAELWPTDGLRLTTGPAVQRHPAVVPDGVGGAIVAWNEDQSKAIRVTANATIPTGWSPEGNTLTVDNQDRGVAAVSDGENGAIVAISGQRYRLPWGGSTDVYAQRISGSGGVVDVPASARTPARELRLWPPRPNPALGGSSRIEFDLSVARRTTTDVFDLTGRLVRRLQDAVELRPGRHTLSWDGLDGAAVPVTSGVYLVRVSAGPASATARLAVVR